MDKRAAVLLARPGPELEGQNKIDKVIDELNAVFWDSVKADTRELSVNLKLEESHDYVKELRQRLETNFKNSPKVNETFRGAMAAPESTSLVESALNIVVRDYVEEVVKARWGLSALISKSDGNSESFFQKNIEEKIQASITKMVWRFVSEATVENSSAKDGKFAAIKDASWTLGRVVLHSIECTPKEQYPTGWRCSTTNA